MSTKKLAIDLPDEAVENLDKYFKENHIVNNIDNRSKFIEAVVRIYMASKTIEEMKNN